MLLFNNSYYAFMNCLVVAAVTNIGEVDVSAKSEPDKAKRIDTSVPFPKFDLGSMIADNIASHSRFNADVFKTTEHQPHAENAANSMNPFYTNMIRSSIFDMAGSGEDANI